MGSGQLASRPIRENSSRQECDYTHREYPFSPPIVIETEAAIDDWSLVIGDWISNLA